MSREFKREPLAEHEASGSAFYHFFGTDGIKDFTYYTQPVDAEPMPVWDDLFWGVDTFEAGTGRIAGLLCADGKTIWAVNDLRLQHIDMAKVEAGEAQPKAYVSIMKDSPTADSPEVTHRARILVGKYAPEDNVAKRCEYAEITGDYLYKQLEGRRDTVELKVEVITEKFETVFEGPLSSYPESKPLLGKLSQKKKNA